MESKTKLTVTVIEPESDLQPAGAVGYSPPSAFHDTYDESQQRAQEKYADAIQSYKSDNMEDGIRFLEEARQLDPHNFEIVVLAEKLKALARLRSESRNDFFAEDYAQAEGKIQRCIAIVQDIEIPNNSMEAKMVMKLSIIAHKVGDEKLSFHYVNKALELNKTYLNAFLHRAYLHRLNNAWDKTIKDLEAAKKIDSHLSKNPYSVWINEAKVEAKKLKK